MSPLDKLTEAVAVAMAEHRARWWAERCTDEFVAAIQAALPEGHYLGREGVVRADEAGRLDVTAWTDDGLPYMETFTGTAEACDGETLFVLRPVEADQ